MAFLYTEINVIDKDPQLGVIQERTVEFAYAVLNMWIEDGCPYIDRRLFECLTSLVSPSFEAKCIELSGKRFKKRAVIDRRSALRASRAKRKKSSSR